MDAPEHSNPVSLHTSDLCDDHEAKLASGELRVFPPIFSHYGKKKLLAGKIVTLKVFEDNSLVRAALEQPGTGQILVVDGGGSLRCALLGGNLAKLAEKNGWGGVIINGCVRDVDEINDCNIAVRALAAMPVKSKKRGQGERDVLLAFGGLRMLPGEWVYGDSDGLLVSTKQIVFTYG